MFLRGTGREGRRIMNGIEQDFGCSSVDRLPSKQPGNGTKYCKWYHLDFNSYSIIASYYWQAKLSHQSSKPANSVIETEILYNMQYVLFRHIIHFK